AITQLPDHFHVIVHPLAQALGLDIFSGLFEISGLRGQLILYLIKHLLYDILWSEVEIGREDGRILQDADPLPVVNVKALDLVDLVAKETDAVTVIDIR